MAAQFRKVSMFLAVLYVFLGQPLQVQSKTDHRNRDYFQNVLIDSTKDTIVVVTKKDGEIGRNGIFFVDDFRFGVLTPKSWTLDDTTGRERGQLGRYFPEGLSWEHSKAVMYISVAGKKTKGHETLERLLLADSIQSVADAPNIKITQEDPLVTSDHKIAAVRSFEYSDHELVAYIDEKDFIIMLVLSSTAEDAFKAALPVFKELVQSYFHVSNRIKLK